MRVIDSQITGKRNACLSPIRLGTGLDGAPKTQGGPVSPRMHYLSFLQLTKMGHPGGAVEVLHVCQVPETARLEVRHQQQDGKQLEYNGGVVVELNLSAAEHSVSLGVF